MIRVVSFDVGGTLVRTERSFSASFCEDIGVSHREAARVRDVVRASPLDRQTRELLATLARVSICEVDSYIDAYVPTFEWQESACDVLARVKKVARVVTLSNVSQPDDASPQWIGELIDESYSSWHTGYVKPDPRSYEHVLTSEAVDPDQIIHVGDDLEADVYGPASLGIRSVYIGSRQLPDGLDANAAASLVDAIDIFLSQA